MTEETKVEKAAPWVWWIFAILLVILVIGSGGLKGRIIKKNIAARPATVYPIAADSQDIWPQVGETIKVEIYPDRWSGWINLPPDAEVLIDAPGEMERLFWTGERIFIKDKNTRWLGTVPHCSSRIRGTKGEVTITVR